MEFGDKIKVDHEKRRYTVMAADDRFVIATKPFAARHTYIYTIVDLKRGVRGACNLIFGPPSDLSTPDGALEALAMLRDGDMEVSYRNVVPLSDAERSHLGHKNLGGPMGKFKPAVTYNEDAKVTEMILEDTMIVWRPWSATAHMGHAVDLGYSTDGRLIGIAIWDDIREPEQK